MANIHHFLGFIMHQPQGNLLELIEREPWTAHQILLAYQRPVKYAERYPDDARFCVCFSGILLEQLQDEHVLQRYTAQAEANSYTDVVNIPSMLERYRYASNIELAGTGYYHPLFPLIPEADWDAHIARGSRKVEEVFYRKPKVFWPPEAGFSSSMIPSIVDQDYKYVICDGVHVKPEKGLSAGEIIYSVHVAEQERKKVLLVPRDGHLSLAQQGGTNTVWFDEQVQKKTDGIDKPSLVTTWTDGENGGWFRQTDENEGFWGFFFAPYMEEARTGHMAIKPISLGDFLNITPPRGKASVLTGTWKSEAEKADGSFRRWAELKEQKEGLRELLRLSGWYHDLAKKYRGKANPSLDAKLESAYEHVLRAEASDNFWWQTDWLPKLYTETTLARELLEQVQTESG